MKAILALEDGTVFEGESFGANGEASGEVVFNTSMTGYQEILTDPSYKGQFVCMTYPLIGNYGVNSDDFESRKPFVSGFIVKENSRIFSNWRAEGSLNEFLKNSNILGIEGIDTRALTRHIRLVGAMKAVISTNKKSKEELVMKAKESPYLIGRDLVKEVTCEKPYILNENSKHPTLTRLGTRNELKVVVIDCGVKYSILKCLAARGCKVIVVPAQMESKKILSYHPDGILISNGPGDPASLSYVVNTVRNIIDKRIPIFGICLGHQILGLALGGKTYKLKFGHHGGNHPVKDIRTGKIDITAQNHDFCVDPKTLNKEEIEITHINLYDQTLEGLRHKVLPIFSVQYHPESSPGPHDANYLFDKFIKIIKHSKTPNLTSKIGCPKASLI